MMTYDDLFRHIGSMSPEQRAQKVIIAEPGQDELVHAVEVVGFGVLDGWDHHAAVAKDVSIYGAQHKVLITYTMDREKVGGVCRCGECETRRGYIRKSAGVV